MYAARAGPGRVWGCDSSEVMCEVARGVCADNLKESNLVKPALHLLQDVPTTSSHNDGVGALECDNVAPLQSEDAPSSVLYGGRDAWRKSSMNTKQQCDTVQSASGGDQLSEAPCSNSEGMRGDQSSKSTYQLSEAECQSFPSVQKRRKKKRNKRVVANQEDDKRRNSYDAQLEGVPDIINLHSKDLMVDSHTLHERVQLVVTETVDAAILGENIVETLIDAWERLLLPPTSATDREASPQKADLSSHLHDTLILLGTPSVSCKENSVSVNLASKLAFGRTGKVIPGRAEAYACLVECDYICRYTKDLRPLRSDSFGRIHVSPVLMPDGDLYNTERLEHLPGGYTELSKWYKVFEVDFDSLEDLKLCANGGKDKYLSLRCDKAGRLDAIALAFKLFVDEENVLESFPHSGSCWEAAVYPERKNRNLVANETVCLQLKSKDFLRLKTVSNHSLVSKLKSKENSPVQCRECVAQQSCRCQGFSEILLTELNQERKHATCSPSEGVAIGGQDENFKNDEIISDNKSPGLFLDSAGMRAFNSSTYNAALTAAAKLVAKRFAANCSLPKRPFTVYDETPLPVASLMLTELLPEVRVCVASTGARDYLDSHNVKGAVCSLDDAASQLPENLRFDAMFMWPVSEIGLLDETLEEKMLFCRQRLSRQGAVFPATISVLLAAMSSSALEAQARAHDTNTHGVRLQGLLNMLQTTHQLDVSLDALPHWQLSPVVSPLTIAFPSGTVSRPSSALVNNSQASSSDEHNSRFPDSRDGLYRSGEGWDTAEGREVLALHKRGLLCTGRNLYEGEVRVRAVNTGTCIGLGHWFGLRGIVCPNNEGEDTYLGISVIDKDYFTDEIFQDSFSVLRGSKSYFEQSIEIFETISCSRIPNMSVIDIQQVLNGKQPVHQEHTSIPNSSGSFPTLSTSQTSLPSPSSSPDIMNVSPAVELFTIGPESPCNQACFLQQNNLHIDTGDWLTLDCVYREGCCWGDVLTSEKQD